MMRVKGDDNMSRSYRKTPYKSPGKRRSKLTRAFTRVARNKYKRDPDLNAGSRNKIDSDFNYELHAGYVGPSWEQYRIERRAEDPYISNKALKREYYKKFRNK